MEETVMAFLWQLMVTALIILCSISGVIGYYSKVKSFKFYSLYSFFLFLYFLLNQEFEEPPFQTFYTGELSSLKWYAQVIYNCSYFLFFLYFLDLKQHIYKFYKFIYKTVVIFGVVASGVYVYSLSIRSPELFEQFYIYIFVPFIFCFAIYTLYKAVFLPGKLKYFAITAGGTFILFAMMALFLPLLGLSFFNLNPFYLFYIGIFVEQIIFAIGLGYKIRNINRSLLEKSRENEQIKENQNRILSQRLKEKEQEIIFIRAKAEEEKLAQLKSRFQDEIAHLHLISLQNQMNPHFIFNALNSIKVFLIENDKEKGVYYLNKFSKLIRNILDSSRGESINLIEELKILKLYVSIENIRFESKINFKITNKDNINLASISLPPMITQPFIENAIWHGLSLKNNADWKIEICFSKKADGTHMIIKDNGVGRKRSEEVRRRKIFPKNSVGLKIVSERIKHFNQKMNVNYSYEVKDLYESDGSSAGTAVVFILRDKKHPVINFLNF